MFRAMSVVFLFSTLTASAAFAGEVKCSVEHRYGKYHSSTEIKADGTVVEGYTDYASDASISKTLEALAQSMNADQGYMAEILSAQAHPASIPADDEKTKGPDIKIFNKFGSLVQSTDSSGSLKCQSTWGTGHGQSITGCDSGNGVESAEYNLGPISIGRSNFSVQAWLVVNKSKFILVGDQIVCHEKDSRVGAAVVGGGDAVGAVTGLAD